MENLHPASFSESLKATLNCYKIASIDSLSGPNGYPALAAQMWFKENKQQLPLITPQQPMVQIPYLIPNDKTVKRSETMLAGEEIACFIVGGEKRLCLPQILTSVLQEYSIAEINQACAELHIYCSRCLPDQLEIFKALGILPINTAQCGLITKTDAERLVSLLMDQHEPTKTERLPKDVEPESGFPVYHECFGRTYGTFHPVAYTSPVAKCIMCEDCGGMFNPERFIAHSDWSFEKRTCHWGFDPENWRSYLLLPQDLEGVKREELQKTLDQMKARFDTPRYEPGPPPTIRYTGSPPTPSKRRYNFEQDSPNKKKMKEEDGRGLKEGFLPHPYAYAYTVPGITRQSAFRPWSPVMSMAAAHSNHGDVPSMQDHLAHLKDLLPFSLSRRAPFPHCIDASTPFVLGNRPSELPLPQHADARIASSVRSPHPSQRENSTKSEGSESAKSSLKLPDPAEGAGGDSKIGNHDDRVLTRSGTPPKADLARKRSFEKSPARHRIQSMSPPPRSSNIAEVSPSDRGRASPTHPTSNHLKRPTLFSRSSNNNNALRETPELDISRPVSRSREAAATAMLELKSSGLCRPGPPPLLPHPNFSPVSSTSGPETPRKLPATPKTAPAVVPLDRLHYKWTFDGQSFFVSAAGFQNLEALRCIVETECGNESGRNRLMHEIVKMKSLHEEKLCIEMRVRRDLEDELVRLRTSHRERLVQAEESRRLFRQEMADMKLEHNRRMEGLRDRIEQRNPKEGCSQDKDNDRSMAERESVEDLISRVLELEASNDKLRLDLAEERKTKQQAELRLAEVESSRERLSFFMESPLSRMMRGVGNVGTRITTMSEDDLPTSSRASLSPGSKRMKLAQVTLGSSMSTPIDKGAAHCQLNGISTAKKTKASTNGMFHEQSIASDSEPRKTAVA